MAYESEDHAYHNELVCNELENNPDYKDWVITTAFYSSLHYLRHAIFPLTFFSAKHSANITATNFNTYCLIEGYEGKKHTVFKKLVQRQCEKGIAIAYNRLLDASYTARYNDYQFSKKIADKAVGRLNAIKTYAHGKRAFANIPMSDSN